MIIENITYSVLSQDSNKPEPFPKIDEEFNLVVCKRSKDTDQEGGDIEEAHVKAEYVNRLGTYVHVIGRGRVDEGELLICDAQYEVTNNYSYLTKIGKLVFKKMIKEV